MNKFYIGVDLEGVACAVGIPGEGMGNGANYAFAAREALREANACARALFDGGADEVIVWDNHGSGVNLDYDEVDPRCRHQHRLPGKRPGEKEERETVPCRMHQGKGTV